MRCSNWPGPINSPTTQQVPPASRLNPAVMSATGQPSCRSMIQHAIPIATPPSTASTENQKLAENASARLSSPIRA